MKTSNTAAWVVGAVIVVALIGWAITRVTNTDPISVGENNATNTPSATNTATGKPSTGGTATGSSNLGETYANATYGFTISYPRELNAQNFGNFHTLNQNDWRFAATQAKRGTPVIEIPVVQIDNSGATSAQKNFPLYYTARVRVGVSTDTAQCYAKDEGYESQTVTDVTIGGVKFKKFSFGGAAMQQYVNGASYRTIRNNKCYVIEQIENGSNYRDETYVGGYSDADLRNFYNKTTPIVQSFRFSK
jgi:hypothetical protein